jgi:uncharacterized membrane protein YbhN (UPF0104 family)
MAVGGLFMSSIRAVAVLVVATTLYGVSFSVDQWGLLVGVFVLTLAVQAVRVLAIWMCAKAVGVDLSPRPYYVMGPLFFLIMLLPITLNGIAVRESFFVNFLGKLHVGADAAFATGFLFFVVVICVSLPGLGIFAWESLRRGARPAVPDV